MFPGLFDGHAKIRDGQRVFVPDVDVSFRASNCVGTDDHPFEHTVGVAFQEAAIHVGAGIALICVTDDVARAIRRSRVTAGLPFPTGIESPAATAAQAGLLDFVDHLRRLHAGECLGQRRVTPEGQVVIDAGRIEEAVAAKDEPILLLIEGDLVLVGDLLARLRVGVEESLNDVSAEDGLGDDLRNVFRRDLYVHDLLGVDHHESPTFTEAVASGEPEPDLLLELLTLDLVLEGVVHVLASVRSAAGPAADRDTRLSRLAFSNQALLPFLELSRRLQLFHLWWPRCFPHNSRSSSSLCRPSSDRGTCHQPGRWGPGRTRPGS